MKSSLFPMIVFAMIAMTTAATAAPTMRVESARGNVTAILSGPWDAVNQRHISLVEVYGTSTTAANVETSTVVTRVQGVNWFVVERPGRTVATVSGRRYEGKCDTKKDANCIPSLKAADSATAAPALSFNPELLFRLPFAGRTATGEIIRADDENLTTFTLTDDSGARVAEYTFRKDAGFWSRRVQFADDKPVNTMETEGLTTVTSQLFPARVKYRVRLPESLGSRDLIESFTPIDYIAVDYDFMRTRLDGVDPDVIQVVRPRA